MSADEHVLGRQPVRQHLHHDVDECRPLPGRRAPTHVNQLSHLPQRARRLRRHLAVRLPLRPAALSLLHRQPKPVPGPCHVQSVRYSSVCLLVYWHCPHIMRIRLYETARCLSVCLSQHGPTAANPLLQVCCCGLGGQEISIDCGSLVLSAYVDC